MSPLDTMFENILKCRKSTEKSDGKSNRSYSIVDYMLDPMIKNKHIPLWQVTQ